MDGCRVWIRDKDDVAAFRCGDKSKDGVELCPECIEKHRKESVLMNGQQCKLSNSDHVFNCHCNECHDNIKGYLGKEVGKVYLYTGKFAPAFLQGKRVTVEHYSTDECEKTSSCECLIKLFGGEGGQISWIPREEIYHNLIEV